MSHGISADQYTGVVVEKTSKLDLGAVEDVPFSLAALPGATVTSLIADLFGIRQGTPPRLQKLLHASLPETAGKFIAPLAAGGALRLPAFLSMTGPGAADNGMADRLDAIRDTSGRVLLAELERCFPRSVPREWRAAVDEPRAFLAAYADLASYVWSTVEPHWRSSRPLLDRETARVGVASVTGGARALLSGLGPRTGLVDGHLLVPAPGAGRDHPPVRKVTLMPLISGTRACAYRVEDTGRLWLGYPLNGLTSLWDARQEYGGRAGDYLALMLGDVRADILRTGGRGPSMGELAARLHCTAGAVTYHCRQLEHAGLLSRERRGRHVRIQRTMRGDVLVDTLS